MVDRKTRESVIGKAASLVAEHPLTAAAVIAGGAAAAAGAFHAARRGMPETIEPPIEDDLEQEIAAGAIAY